MNGQLSIGMHSKIIQPGKHGRMAYDNKGSCKALVAYLGHEARDSRTPLSFFNSTHAGICSGEVEKTIDYHVKGLRKEEVKFYSLVISPSQDELRHLGAEDKRGKNLSDNQQSNHQQFNLQPGLPNESYSQKLELFTRQVMENYAANFNVGSGRKLSAADLQWYATIHYQREYKGVDQKVKEGEAKKGTLKPGLNTHVHIIVAKRDSTQQISLNPQGRKERFDIRQWQKANETSFDKLFEYKREEKQEAEKSDKLTAEQKERLHHRISRRLSIINNLLERGEALLQQKVEQVAQEKGYSETFFYNLNRLETNLRKGAPVQDPLHLLEHNKDRPYRDRLYGDRPYGINQKPERLERVKQNEQTLGNQIENTFKVLATEQLTMEEDLALCHSKPRFRTRTYPHVSEQKRIKRGATQSI